MISLKMMFQGYSRMCVPVSADSGDGECVAAVGALCDRCRSARAALAPIGMNPDRAADG